MFQGLFKNRHKALSHYECYETVCKEAPEAMKEILSALTQGKISAADLVESISNLLPTCTSDNIRVALARAIEYAGMIARGKVPPIAFPSHASPFFYQPLVASVAMSPKGRRNGKLH